MNFLQFLADLYLLRTVLFTLATFGAVRRSLLRGKQMVIEHETQILVLEHENVVVEGKIQRDIHPIWAWHTISAPGATDPKHVAIDFANVGNCLAAQPHESVPAPASSAIRIFSINCAIELIPLRTVETSG